jgi:hypothetical protein
MANYDVVWKETGEVRPPQCGEWFLNSRGCPEQAIFDFEATELPIMRLVKTENTARKEG